MNSESLKTKRRETGDRRIGCNAHGRLTSTVSSLRANSSIAQLIAQNLNRKPKTQQLEVVGS